MKKLIAIALLTLSLSGAAQKFGTLFTVDTINSNVVQLINKTSSLYVNQDDATDSIELAPILLCYRDQFKELGMILHGFWISKWIHEPIGVFFNGKEIKMHECSLSKDSNYPWHNIYVADTDDEKKFTGINDKIVIGNKTYVAVKGFKGLISTKISNFNKVTCDWYE